MLRANIGATVLVNRCTVAGESARFGLRVNVGSLRSGRLVAEVGKLVDGSCSRRWMMTLRRDAGRRVEGRRPLLIEMILLRG